MSCMLTLSLGLLVWMLRLMNFNELLVFIVIWLMCFAHDKSHEILGLLRVSEYSDIRGSEFKIEYEYMSLPKSLDRDLFFFFLPFFLTETRRFSQNGPLKFFTMTTILIDNISYSNTFVSCRLVTPFIRN